MTQPNVGKKAPFFPTTRFGWLLATVLILVMGSFVYLASYAVAMGEGSPKFAQEWATVFQGLPDPQVAAEKYPEIATVRFASGEWLFAIDKSSHGHKDGGTIVIRDSCGKIRVFFGHVCGGQYVNSVRRGIKQDLWLRDVELKVPEKIMKARYEGVELPAEVTLDDFYKKLLELKMWEYDRDGADQA